MNFDYQAEKTIKKLSNAFGLIHTPKPNLVSPYSVGIEVEVKFRHFFTEIFEKYFDGKKYSDYSSNDKKIISDLIVEEEKTLLPLLETVVECGIPRGLDKYWEFSFPPVHNLTLLIYQIEILKKAKLIPTGQHSLHISIGGSKLKRKHFYMLMFLELLYADKHRIEKGFRREGPFSDSWAKKGDGGILRKNEYDLVEQNVGFELRTLYLKDDTDIYGLFSLLRNFLNDDYGNEIISTFSKKIVDFGLPDINWEKPHVKPEIWNIYIKNFDELSNCAKNLLKCDEKFVF